MASLPKKPHLECDQVQTDQQLFNFLAWMNYEGIVMSHKVRLTKMNTSNRFGMVTVEDVEEGETLFSVPRTAILSPHSCAIRELLDTNQNALLSRSQWVPLLIALMYETQNPQSRWRPYLDLVPNYEEMDQPMFWDRDLMKKELQATTLIEAVDNDVRRMKKEYKKIAEPFFKKNPHVFRLENYSFELYKKMVAFIMAYSFTEPPPDMGFEDSDDEENDLLPNPPVMVPLADMLNHTDDNNAKLQFNTNLDMISIKRIPAGEEVYNTYGEMSNCSLLHMYGFSLRSNRYDTVSIPYHIITEEYWKLLKPDEITLCQKYRILERAGLIEDEDGVMIVGTEGVLTKEESYEVFKVMFMDEEKFAEVWETETWSDHGQDLSLSNDDIPKLDKEWRIVLANAAKRRLRDYPTAIDVDKEILAKVDSNETEITRRELWSLYLRHQQKDILQKLVTVCAVD